MAGQAAVSRQVVHGPGANAELLGDLGCGEHQASASKGLRTPLAPVLDTCV